MLRGVIRPPLTVDVTASYHSQTLLSFHHEYKAIMTSPTCNPLIIDKGCFEINSASIHTLPTGLLQHDTCWIAK